MFHLYLNNHVCQDLDQDPRQDHLQVDMISIFIFYEHDRMLVRALEWPHSAVVL